MKIISKHSDYYDYVAYMLGKDDSITYIRKTEDFDGNSADIFSIKETPRAFNYMRNIVSDLQRTGRHIWFVGIGGRMYHGLAYRAYLKSITFQDINEYLSEGLSSFKNRKNLLTLEATRQKRPSYDLESEITNLEHTISNFRWRAIHKFDLKAPQGTEIELTPFEKLETPVFLVEARSTPSSGFSNGSKSSGDLSLTIIKNPILRDLDFDKKLPAEQCFQEIDMMLGKLFGPSDNADPISDELRRDAHGFNNHSFKHRK